jgi:hypothetical protein
MSAFDPFRTLGSGLLALLVNLRPSAPSATLPKATHTAIKSVTTASSRHCVDANFAHGLIRSRPTLREATNAMASGLLFGALPAAALIVSTAAAMVARKNIKRKEKSIPAV